MPEERTSISSSRIAAADVARHAFGTVRRGFDPQEVRAYLELVARELGAWEQHEQELRRQLGEAEERARHPVIDESTLSAALGQQSAQVLRKAHEEAARTTREAEESAGALVREAQSQAAEVRVQAESGAAERIAEAEIAVGTVHQQAQQDAAQILETARADAEAVVARAREQGQAMVDQAQETRRRVLADMAQRRRAMTLQIEQFRAARDELASSVLGVRQAVDRIVDDLSRADDEARAAAADVARRQPVELSATSLTEEIDHVQAVLDAEAAAPTTGGVTVVPAPSAPSAPSEAWPAPGEEGSATPTEEATTGPVPPAPTGEPTAGEPIADEPATDEPAGGAVLPPPHDEAVHDDVLPPLAPVDEEGEVDVVEGLFARLRASQPEASAGAAAVPGSAPTAGPASGVEAALAPTAEEASDVAGASPGEPSPGDPSAEVPGSDQPSPADDVEPTDPDDPVRSRGAELLDPVVSQLARRLKRALQDDQNGLLDRLRSGSGTWTDDALAPEEQQRQLYVEAAAAQLTEAAAAGIAFARAQRGSRGKAPSPDQAAMKASAEQLATTVVTLLRRRLTDQDSGGDSAADRVGAAYREWRGERIERLVGDSALGAFSQGVLQAAGRGTGLRWVVGGAGPACADCDDNALAGTVPPGEEFPTGHRHPPAHAGCRCLVVPTPA